MAQNTNKNKTSTQENIPVSAVYDSVIVSKNGSFSQVIMVNSVNFGLKSEEEQTAIISQYQGFLNSLGFPIQIVLHSKKLDLTSYLKDLKDRIPQESNELVRYQIQEYVDFVEKLISIANIMDKKFFITVSHQLPASDMPKAGLLSYILGISRIHLKVPLSKFETIKEELEGKTNTVISGLASMGVSSQVLATKQIIELFYRTYNPEEAMREKLKGDIGDIGVAEESQTMTAGIQAATISNPQNTTASPTTTPAPQPQTPNVPISNQAPAPNTPNTGAGTNIPINKG
jgi:hypothetical protein